MTWAEACQALLEGKKVTRAAWWDSCVLALEKRDVLDETSCIRWPNNAVFCPTREHLEATDWEIIENENQ